MFLSLKHLRKPKYWRLALRDMRSFDHHMSCDWFGAVFGTHRPIITNIGIQTITDIIVPKAGSPVPLGNPDSGIR